MVTILPIPENHAAGFRACLDTVAREKRYLAQVEAPPLERVRQFVHDSVANDVAQFVAVDDAGQVVGWADIFPAWAHAVAHWAEDLRPMLLHVLGRSWGHGTCRLSLCHGLGVEGP